MMEQTKMMYYEDRILTASKGRLLLITFELMLEEMKDARRYLERNDFTRFKKSLDQGQKILGYLMETLDTRFDISKELIGVYFYINKQLAISKISRKVKGLNDAIHILERMMDGFEEVVDSQDDGQPLIESIGSPFIDTFVYGRNGQLV